MIVFTSASASIVFISFGGIPTDYAVAVFVIGAVFTMLGQVSESMPVWLPFHVLFPFANSMQLMCA